MVQVGLRVEEVGVAFGDDATCFRLDFLSSQYGILSMLVGVLTSASLVLTHGELYPQLVSRVHLLSFPLALTLLFL